jgi:hypothetical protein
MTRGAGRGGRACSARAATRAGAPPRPPGPVCGGPALEPPGPWALAASGALLALLLAAPPASNAFWGVDGLRSLPLPFGVLAIAVAGFVTLAAMRMARWRWMLPLAAAVALAFPLHERLHLLGDTWVRTRFIERCVFDPATAPHFRALGEQLHAQPLDNLIGCWGAIHMAPLLQSITGAVSAGSLLLAVLYFAALGQLARRFDAGEFALPLAFAIALAGTLETFAGYAESGGIVLAAGAWWWVTLLRPLERPRDAAAVALAWLALFLSHRIALVALIPQLARAFIVLPGDRVAARRLLVAVSLVAGALAWAALRSGVASQALGQDFEELGMSLRDWRALRLVAPVDLANLVVLVMPLALLAPLLAGVRAVREFVRSRSGLLHAIAFVPLTPLLLVFPAAPHGLGAHRDWELAALPGLIANSAGAALLVCAAPARRRAALWLVLPLLALIACGWVGLHADERASERSALALASGPGRLEGAQRAHLLTFLAYRAADRDDNARSAAWFDSSFAALPNVRTTMLAAEAWLRAGDVAAARRAMARAHARGPYPPELAAGGAVIDRMIATADSIARVTGTPPTGMRARVSVDRAGPPPRHP